MSALEELAERLDHRLAAADGALAADYPGQRTARQPVHTAYVPADRYLPDTVAAWGVEAAATLDSVAGAAASLAEVFQLRPDLAAPVHQRVRAKLAAEPIEDLRVDFEDGYGIRTDREEDAAIDAAADTLATAVKAASAPPFHGIRIKSFEAPTRRRGLRTLDRFVARLAAAGALTDRFVVTLPKVTSVDQVAAMADGCGWIEAAHALAPGILRFEIQVETQQAILGSDGTALVAPMIRAAAGRCTGLHYGTYDYSAALGVAAAYQSMDHPVADHAKAVMQVAAAGTGVVVCDGSTNVLPVGDDAAVRAAWQLHYRLVRRSLAQGIYQGWDLHPAQLPSRYAATYAFFREGLDTATSRLQAYVSGAESAYLDEPATAAALARFVRRGLECGAVDADEVDIDPAELAVLAGVTDRKVSGKQCATK